MGNTSENAIALHWGRFFLKCQIPSIQRFFCKVQGTAVENGPFLLAVKCVVPYLNLTPVQDQAGMLSVLGRQPFPAAASQVTRFFDKPQPAHKNLWHGQGNTSCSLRGSCRFGGHCMMIKSLNVSEYPSTFNMFHRHTQICIV